MRYFKVTFLPKFRLKRRKFPALKIRIKWVRIEKAGQNLGYDRGSCPELVPHAYKRSKLHNRIVESMMKDIKML
ncbi:hypothetical protein MTR_0173s0010 [Medicago truncatula]|uniref:Uncharacterized protein n=1 Tax=Medicago truncatula TaxID=3880 RepID=A0A072TGI5_MEDTR|nr:hypothetical protein MTR_0173s0010 [Medicago truncatula]